MNNFENPEELVQTFVDGWNGKDARKLASIFVERAEFVNVTGLWWHNKERIYKAHEYGLRVIFNDSSLQVLQTKTRMLAEDVAMLHTKMRLEKQTPFEQVSAPAKRTNILIFICKKYETGWLCEAVQNTEIIPGMETFIADEGGSMSAVNYGEFGR